VARQRYIRAVQEYNVTVRSFPSNLDGHAVRPQVKPSFTVGNDRAISKPPTVDFSKPESAPAPARNNNRMIFLTPSNSGHGAAARRRSVWPRIGDPSVDRPAWWMKLKP